MANLREKIADELKRALRAKDAVALATMRLISAALKDRDIAARAKGNREGIEDDEILSMMQTMVKQRNESARMYREGERPELADAEEAEIAIITQFLPEQLDREAVGEAIIAAIETTGASSIKDMGQVMAHLKSAHAGQMDFSEASKEVRKSLIAQAGV